MSIAVVSDDANFVAAVTGIAGAMGHKMTADRTGGTLTVIDGALAAAALAEAVRNANGLRTVVFIPQTPGPASAVAQAANVLHVYPRRSLAVELPRLIALHAAE